MPCRPPFQMKWLQKLPIRKTWKIKNTVFNRCIILYWIHCITRIISPNLFIPISSLPICPPPLPSAKPMSDSTPSFPCTSGSGLEKCFIPHCGERNTSQECEGVVGCYWCKHDKDDIPLIKPYCAAAEVCFRGKEGQPLPYLNIIGQPIESYLSALLGFNSHFYPLAAADFIFYRIKRNLSLINFVCSHYLIMLDHASKLQGDWRCSCVAWK